jgi:transketolase
MPNMTVLRPSDATETVEAWRVALTHTEGPVGLVLTRQKLSVIDRKGFAPASGLAQGAYVLADAIGSAPDVILIATGSEVSIALDAHERLTKDGIRSRVVSMPSWELFRAQDDDYRFSVLPVALASVSVEAGVSMGWTEWVDASVAIDRFGASAPGQEVLDKLGITPDAVAAKVKELLD